MPRKTQGFTGQLLNFALLDIIQMGCLAQRDGRLIVRNGRRRAEVILARGRIVHAATKGQVGEDALLEILSWDKGQFQFGPIRNGIHSGSTIQGGWERVLMDAVRKRDELKSAGFSESITRPVPNDRFSADNLLTQIEQERSRIERARLIKRVFLTASLLCAAFVATYFISIKHHRLIAYASNLQKGVRELVERHARWQHRTAQRVVIPEGEFIYQDGERLSLKPFAIDSEVLSKDVLCVLKGFFRKLLTEGNWGIWGKKVEHPRTMFDLVLSVKIGIVGGV
jgi:uncharacterized protein DUF4388